MPAITVTIVRFTDESQPGWVECTLVDAVGVTHVFEEKVPIVTTEHLDAQSAYPRDGVIECTVISTRWADGRELLTVDTERPAAIQSKAGHVRFEVFSGQVLM